MRKGSSLIDGAFTLPIVFKFDKLANNLANGDLINETVDFYFQTIRCEFFCNSVKFLITVGLMGLAKVTEMFLFAF